VIEEASWLAIWNEPDLEAVRAMSADDLEVTAVTAAIEPRHYSGPDAAVSWLVELRERLQADWQATKLTMLADDALVTEGELKFHEGTGTGADRGAFAVLMRLRRDKIRWIGTFVTLEAAREAWQLGIGADEP
jgi:ABC-type sugar transport system substrate-binding protein